MDWVPLLREGQDAGELTVEREGLYDCFSVTAHVPEGLWCAWLVGERGESRLGVLEPRGGRSVIRRRISGRMTEPLGTLLRGEVRPVLGGIAPWEEVPEPADLFRTDWLRRQLEFCRNGLVRRSEGRLRLALPYGAGQPFGLESLFCFAQIRRIGGNFYTVFLFDEEEWPLFEK